MESILFLALTPEMAQIATQAMRELNLSFRIEVVNTEEKVKHVIRANPQVNVMISRGLMVDLIKKNTDNPVVGLSMTIDEMLEAVQKLINGGATKVGVVAYRGLLDMGSADFTVGQVSIHIRPWNTLEDIPRILEQLRKDGVNAIAGDKGGYTTAQEEGYTGVFLESGLLATKRAISESLKLAQAQERERAREREKRLCFEQVIAELYADIEMAASFVQELAASSEELAATSQETSNIAHTTTQEVNDISEILKVIRRIAQDQLTGTQRRY